MHHHQHCVEDDDDDDEDDDGDVGDGCDTVIMFIVVFGR